MTDAYRYVELQCASHFSFLRGASSCEDLFAQAVKGGLSALAITDRNSLAGIVRAHEAAKDAQIQLIVGCQLILTDGAGLLVYPTDRAAYARLCRLLSLGKARGGKAHCVLSWDDLAPYAEGMIAIFTPDYPDDTCLAHLRRTRSLFADHAFMALTLQRRPQDQMRLHALDQLARQAGVAPVVTNNVLYHDPSQRILHDVVTCIREGCTIDALGFRRERTADRHLKSAREMHRLFARYPEALARTVAIAACCRFTLDDLRYQYPHEIVRPGLTAQQTLVQLTWEGARHHYPDGIPDPIAATLRHELQLIDRLQYAPYFLTVHAIVHYARDQGILCQGRGSAANSAVCYVLGITAINPARHDMLFERFISEERNEPPDIDVDFEHEHRETVIQWIYTTYGRHRAALCATVIRYRPKGALRDVGKALGVAEDRIKAISSQIWDWYHPDFTFPLSEEIAQTMDRRLRLTLDLARALIGTPRHLSQHPGGFVLTHDRLDELVPIEPAAMEDRQIIEWDKDDIDCLKFMKVDILALGMLTCLQRGFTMLAQSKNIHLTLTSIPPEDPATYDMICRADTIGVFQIESRAQMAMLPRLKPRLFYDLVIQIAIVRPGPIQGDMVHPYLRRREGREHPSYPSAELKNVLHKTLGIPLFQEQAMRVAIDCAGFSAGEADQLRRAMATFKNTGTISKFAQKLIGGMTARGYAQSFADQIFRQLEGFGSYGFPESHAASFALLAYASAWMKCRHPDVFCAALLNAQPMGFYAPAQIIRDARTHGVEIRPICINRSRWDAMLEPTPGPYHAVRLGLRLADGLNNEQAAAIISARGDRPFSDLDDLWQRVSVPTAALERLANADAFADAWHLSRRDALWAVKALRDTTLPLFAAASARDVGDQPVVLPAMKAGHAVMEDYTHTGLSLRAHPIAFLRGFLTARTIAPCRDILGRRDGHRISLAGLVLMRQRPPSAKGVMFVTLEDETGIANIVVWPDLFERQRRVLLTSRILGIDGRVQREGEIIHIIATCLYDHSDKFGDIRRSDEAVCQHPGMSYNMNPMQPRLP